MRGFVVLLALSSALVSGCTFTSNFGDFKFDEPDKDAGGDGDRDGEPVPDGDDGQDGTPQDGTPDGADGDDEPDAGPPPDPICEAAKELCDEVATCSSTTGVAVCKCPAGYFDMNGDGSDCVDLNECRAGTFMCDPDATCSNTAGGYDCLCNPGFIWDNSAKDCLDSCLVLLSTTCDPDVGVCTKPDGDAVCRCPAGYMDVAGDGSDCEADIACMMLECDPLAECDSTGGNPQCTCPTGFSGDGQTCDDVDECTAGTDDCDDNATCTNTEGGFACTCKEGYAGSGKSCNDVNECTAESDLCSDNATCTNTVGAYTCRCRNGYGGDGFSCADNDECDLGTDDCSANANCTNTPGTFSCACKSGFSGNGVTCSDVNECTTNTDNCAANEECNNTEGSFTCGCDPGYTKNASGQCVDVNECTADTDNCSANANCANTAGSFTCTCRGGYSGDGVSCLDVNECTANTDNCSDNANCTNTGGSFSCACRSGYTGDGVSCTNVNECANANTNNCHTTRASCIDNPGSYTCTCNSGYAGDGITCTDNNECQLGTSTCDTAPDACVNTTGGFTCTCPDGYSGNGVGANGCTDTNECLLNLCDTSPAATCANNAGGYTCTCPSGYTGNGIGLNGCTDINECTTSNPCDTSPAAACTNNAGSYSCACPSGYTGNGVGAGGCTDTNECLSNPCDASPAATCTNNAGSFACACPSGYSGTGVGTSGCTDTNECTAGTPCDTSPVAACTNSTGSFSCACPGGYTGDGVGAGGCTDTNECTNGTENCDDLPTATCNNTGGSYTCTCPAGYSGSGLTQTGCCTPSGTEAANPNDGVDNDCDGKIDAPIVRNTTFPAPSATTSFANVSIAITASTVTGATLQCRHYKRSGTAGAFATCANPITNTTAGTAANNGAWRTDVRWLFASGAISSTTSHDYYVHHTLNGVAKCTSTVTADATWFTKAAERLATPSAGTFITSGASRDTFTTLPFVRVTYDVPLAGTFNSDGDGILSVLLMDDALHSVEMLSLRKRFAVSADGKYLLITRAYASTGSLSGNGGNSCDVFNMKSHDSFYIGSTKDKQHLRYTCDAVVLSRSGAGVCLNASGATAVFAKEFGDTQATLRLGYTNANKFLWRELVQKREKTKRMKNFTTKCYSGAGCNVYGPNFPATYLPDRSLFP